jgi:hypothetical protein
MPGVPTFDATRGATCNATLGVTIGTAPDATRDATLGVPTFNTVRDTSRGVTFDTTTTLVCDGGVA